MRKLISIDHADDGIQIWHGGHEPMPRYVRQKDSFRCAAIGLANALKWAGAEISWRENKHALTRAVRCCPYHGTDIHDISRALKHHGAGYFSARYRTPKKVTMGLLRDEIAKGGAVLIGFDWPKLHKALPDESHITLLVDIVRDSKGREYFGLVNLGYTGEKYPLEYIQARTFRKLCMRRGWNDVFWLLRKRLRQGT